MCMFSQAVEVVSGTQIFARDAGRSQFLAYSMSVRARRDLAMILPLPVPPGSADDAVRFINLQAYSTFFDDLRGLFEEPSRSLGVQSLGRSRGGPLVVHDVGMFEASFVPSIADFDRLDARFRLPTEIWNNLPQYKDWGFAVFKLKGHQTPEPAPRSWVKRLIDGVVGASGSLGNPSNAAQPIHPMAFEFPRRDESQLFFPTLHIHDGVVHPQARFDHDLYCQMSTPPPLLSSAAVSGVERFTVSIWDVKKGAFQPTSWEGSNMTVEQGMDRQRAGALLGPETRVYRQRIVGTQTNQDTVIKLRS